MPGNRACQIVLLQYCAVVTLQYLFIIWRCDFVNVLEKKLLDDHLKLLTVWLCRGRLWISVKGQEIIFGGRVLRRFSGGVGCISHTKTHTELHHWKMSQSGDHYRLKQNYFSFICPCLNHFLCHFHTLPFFCKCKSTVLSSKRTHHCAVKTIQ